MDANGFRQRGMTAIATLGVLSGLSLAGACAGAPGDVAGPVDPGLGSGPGDPDGSAMYTPYADVPIQPITNAPFPAPDFVRPSFQNRRFNIVDFGAVSD